MAEEEIQEEQEESGGEGKSPIVKILIIVIAAVVILAIAVVVAFKVATGVVDDNVKGNTGTEMVDDMKTKEPLMTWEMTKKAVTYNLKAQKNQKKGALLFAKVILAFTPENSGAASELESRAPQVRDIFITTLGSMTAQELDVQYLSTIKDKLKEKINTIMETKIEDIYFEEYYIQK